MNTITIEPELLEQYLQMTKNELLLHLTLRSLSSDRKRRRNVRQFAKRFGTGEQRVRDAEYGLQRRGLLRVHYINNRRWWFVYDAPIGKESENMVPVVCKASCVEEKENTQLRPGLFQRLKNWLVGTQLSDFNLTEE